MKSDSTIIAQSKHNQFLVRLGLSLSIVPCPGQHSQVVTLTHSLALVKVRRPHIRSR